MDRVRVGFVKAAPRTPEKLIFAARSGEDQRSDPKHESGSYSFVPEDVRNPVGGERPNRSSP